MIADEVLPFLELSSTILGMAVKEEGVGRILDGMWEKVFLATYRHISHISH